jgi:hypothetical protein
MDSEEKMPFDENYIVDENYIIDEEICRNCTYDICAERCPLREFLEME